MSHDEAATPWYQPPAALGPAEWPDIEHLRRNVSIPAETFWDTTDEGTPVLYSKPGRTAGTRAATTAGEARRRLFVDIAAKDVQSELTYIGMPAKEGHAGVARMAIAAACYPPRRFRDSEVPGGRRPVVALLDTGIGEHEWFADPDSGPFWEDAEYLGWVPPTGGELPGRGTGDVTPEDDKTDSHAGHGTFIAGLIRQIAPDAKVLSMHVMRGDGVLDEQTVLKALEWLRDRARGAAGDPSLFVDVVCLSFGYYEQAPDDEVHTRALRQILRDLGELGVQVVASAGNHASPAPVYPAAFADPAAGDKPPTALVSVGALNPDGSRAAYSNFGGWVTTWDVGTAVVSAVPQAFGTTSTPQTEEAVEYRPENLGGGFARWGGTSFSAAAFAGRLARALTDHATGGSMLALDSTSAHERAAAALQEARTRVRAQFEREAVDAG